MRVPCVALRAMRVPWCLCLHLAFENHVGSRVADMRADQREELRSGVAGLHVVAIIGVSCAAMWEAGSCCRLHSCGTYRSEHWRRVLCTQLCRCTRAALQLARVFVIAAARSQPSAVSL